jgi:hypothetical protein
LEYEERIQPVATIFPIDITTAVPGYRFENSPDLSRYEIRERLSQSAMDGFFAIVEKWSLSIEEAGLLLGGVPRSTLHRLRTGAGVRSQDELTRIGYLVAIFKTLHIIFDRAPHIADAWMTNPNDGLLFGGARPVDFAVREGMRGLQEIRRLLDAARGGR